MSEELNEIGGLSEAKLPEPTVDAPVEWRAAGKVGPTLPLPALRIEAEDAKPAFTPSRRPRGWRPFAIAAGLAAMCVTGVAAAALSVHALRTARNDLAAAHAAAERVRSLSARVDRLQTDRIPEELAALRKTLAEIKTSAANARDLGGAAAQLSARVDRLEKDQSGRLERMDRDAAGRLADLNARLDKLEGKVGAVAARDGEKAVAELGGRIEKLEKAEAKPSAAVAAAPAKPTLVKADPPKAEAPVSNETTGSIPRAAPRLRGYALLDVHNGYAMIGGPFGELAVAPGDRMPNGGRVMRIERHGRDWVVVTTQGEIVAAED